MRQSQTVYLHGFQLTKLIIDRRKESLSTIVVAPNSEQFICSKLIPLDQQEKAQVLLIRNITTEILS